MSKITLPSGIVLDTDGGWAQSLTAHAKHRGMPEIVAFLAQHPGGDQEYVLVRYTGSPSEGHGEAIYASTKYEEVYTHLEILWLDKTS